MKKLSVVIVVLFVACMFVPCAQAYQAVKAKSVNGGERVLASNGTPAVRTVPASSENYLNRDTYNARLAAIEGLLTKKVSKKYVDDKLAGKADKKNVDDNFVSVKARLTALENGQKILYENDQKQYDDVETFKKTYNKAVVVVNETKKTADTALTKATQNERLAIGLGVLAVILGGIGIFISRPRKPADADAKAKAKIAADAKAKADADAKTKADADAKAKAEADAKAKAAAGGTNTGTT